MTIRSRMQRRVTLAPTLYMSGIVVLVAVDTYLWLTQRYAALFIVMSGGLCALFATVFALLRSRCPRCHAGLPWPSDRVARDYAIRSCVCCGVKFDITLLRRRPTSETTVVR